MSMLVDALPEFLGSIAATITVSVVRWSASALRGRTSRGTEESEPG
ncbi:hypothetical protein [Streptomyces lunaelactis]|nr:hypothetical protein [Streptomyces lunaelactis]NUK84931.1 hypothetical protein [Streptomyces lunaelactis]